MSIHANKLGIWVSSCANFGGDEPPYLKIQGSDLHFQSVYVNGTPGEDPFVTPALLNKTRGKDLLACTWFVPRSADAVREAQKAADMVMVLNPDAVMLDVETHDIAFQRLFIAEYRRLKPGRATDWTFEPRQSASTVAVPEILAARMDLFPQMYRDTMRDADPKHELRYWSEVAGWDRVHLVLDAATDWWQLGDGLLFSAERLA